MEGTISGADLLEGEPQTELEIAHLRVRSRIKNLAGFRNITINAVPGLAQVDMVEYVETLRTEFKIRTFGYSEFLE